MQGMERRACGLCHRRKVRCDAHTVGFPCRNCRALGKEDECHPHEKRKRARRSAVNTSMTSRFLPSLPAASAVGALCTPPPPPPPPQQLVSVHEPQTEHQGPASQSAGSTSMSSIPTPEEQLDNIQVKRHLADFFGQEDLNDRPIGLGVRMCYVGTDVSNLHFLVRQRERTRGVHHFPTHQFSRRLTTYEPSLIPSDAFVVPDKALTDELIHAYFEHVAPGFPIIDESLFMAQYNNRDPADPPSLLVLQAMLLVASHVNRPQPERDALKATFFRRAKLLLDARHERDRLFVVQAALLMTWHSDGAEDITANSWHYVGIAARAATGLGMHCDVKPSRLVPHDKRTWRRVWWILVQFDVLTSLAYGRPQAINLEDCDVPSLTPDDFEGCGDRTEVDYVIKFTELCVLISSILRARFSARKNPERRKQVLRRADETLAEWFLHLPEHLHLRYSKLDLWPAFLHMTYNNFLITLHRPQPFATDDTPDYGPNDGDICGEAASAIVSIAEGLRETDRLKYSWISSVNCLFTAMIQVNAELRFSNPVLAIPGQRRFDSAMLSLRYLSEYWLSACTVLRLFEEKSEVMKHNPPAAMASGHGRHGRNPADGPPAAAPSVDNNNGGTDGAGENDRDWRQLFSFVGTDREPFHAPPIEDDEWRELYWQDITLPDLGDEFFLNV